MQQRPTGVTVLAILAFIGGVFGILGACAAFGLGGLGLAGAIPDTAGAPSGAQVAGLGLGLGVFSLIIGILDLAFGYGAWTLKPWAWTLGVGLQAFSILSVVAGWIFTGFNASSLISLVISGIILYYLFTPLVKRAFGRA